MEQRSQPFIPIFASKTSRNLRKAATGINGAGGRIVSTTPRPTRALPSAFWPNMGGSDQPRCCRAGLSMVHAC